MINKENFSFYLRYLCRITDTKPIHFKEIPKEFQQFFSIPGLSESLNISIRKLSPVDWSKVEKYIDDNTFSNFNSLAKGIKDHFQTPMDKLYAVYYYVTHHIQYDWERFLMKERDSLSIDQIFQKNKGVCSDYSDFFITLSKKVGITSKIMTILKFGNTSKGYGYDPLNPPKEPKRDHACVFLEIDGESFLSEPTWGAGPVDDNGVFSFNYKKCNFLIPYYYGCLSHYPDSDKFPSHIYPFPYEKFTELNKSDFSKEVSFESNPFLVINVDNGKYEMQFSFLQPGKRATAHFFILKGKEWSKRDSIFASFTCLERDLPSHSFTYHPEEKRCRYKMSICFPEDGQWCVDVFGDGKNLFNNYYIVKGAKAVLDDIPGDNKEEACFKPITPLKGLTDVTKGFVRIRFAIKLKRAGLSIRLRKIKKETFQREDESDTSFNKFCRTFTSELPFEYSKSEDEEEGERLVEDWIFVEFPENGRWEVCIYFKNDEGSYSYGVTYYFDVTGADSDSDTESRSRASAHNKYPIYDVPKSLKFIPFKTTKPEEVWTEPSTSVVILKELDAYFHIFSEKKLKVYFVQTDEKDGQTIWPTLMSENETGSNNIVDREYSVTFTKSGCYEMNLYGEKFLGRQKYFIVDFELPEESKEEKNLMKKLKEKLEDKLDYTEDIPTSIQKNVEKLLKDAKKHKEEEAKREKKNKSEIDEKEIQRRREEERHREEEDQEEMRRQEKEERDRKEKERKEKIEIEKLEKQKQQQQQQQQKRNQTKPKNIKIKSSSSQAEITNLRQIASDLEQQNQKLDLRLDELERRENLMKLDFVKQIDQIRKEWEKKDQKLNEERLESSRKRKIEFEDIERREKLLSERRISLLTRRIRNIEEQLEFDPEKRKEFVELQQQLIEEENKDIFNLSSRRQKRIEEERQEELEFEEKKVNEKIKKMQIIKEFDEKIKNSVCGGEDDSKVEREKMENKKRSSNQEQLNTNEKNNQEKNDEVAPQSKSKTCILI